MNTKTPVSLRWILLSAALVAVVPARAQTPFLRTGQVFIILQNSHELQEFEVEASSNSLNSSEIGPLPAGGLDALGFRRTDNLLYGIGTANNHLYQLDASGLSQDLGPVGLDNSLFYLAGDVTPDGRYLVSIGSDASGNDIHLAKTDLATAGYPTQFVPLVDPGHMADVAFEPGSGRLLGFDQINSRLAIINTDSGYTNGLQSFQSGNTLYGLYFDAFGDLYGLGSTLYGIVDGFFQLDKITGKERRLVTGPTTMVSDMASCPFSLEMKNAVDPAINLPCTKISYTFTLANGSDETFTDLAFSIPFPPGFHLAAVLQNTFGGMVDTLSVPGSIRMEHIHMTPGIRQLKISMSVGDIPKGNYTTQAIVSNLPILYGSVCPSDFPDEAGFEDGTNFFVNRFDEDSLDFAWFLCLGDELVLESADYGANVVWNNGSTLNDRVVTKGGSYSFTAGSTCEEIVVNHEVTSATCPFTIAVKHIFEPDTIFACSELIFRFIISNDSGEPRANLSMVDSLPPGFSFVALEHNPFGGALQPNLPQHVFCLEGMTLMQGVDTLDVRVLAGDVPPGAYKNRAVLFGLPVLMGPLRLSDNPYTFPFDSSTLRIKGALSDSVFYAETICKNAAITLDAADLGENFLWANGSNEARQVVTEPGFYHLTLFDGCEPAEIFWDVKPGLDIDIEPIQPVQIHQGESLALNPVIMNAGDSLFVRWYDPLNNSLSCLNCPGTTATPLESTVYGLKVDNETCYDSMSVVVEVDQQRRIYASNVFSPNSDGENDTFYLQSPDFGYVKTFQVYDRWGNMLFQSKETELLNGHPAWDGFYQNNPAPSGVYLWWASIKFIDGREEVFSGDVMIVR